MSHGECMNPVHSPAYPRFSENDVKCRICGGFKWRWASWSQAQRRIPLLVTAIAEFERGRVAGYREHAKLTEALYDRLAAERPTSRVCVECKGIGRAEGRVCPTCYGTGEEKVK